MAENLAPAEAVPAKPAKAVKEKRPHYLPTTDIGKMGRLEEFMRNPEGPGIVFEMLTSSEVDKSGFPRWSLARIAKELGLAKGRFVEWFMSEHGALYDTALKVVAADLAIQAMGAAMEATPEDVAVKRLQSEVALKLAARFDRMRYGEQSVQVRSAVLVADAGLLGEAGALLARLSAPIEREVKGADDAG